MKGELEILLGEIQVGTLALTISNTKKFEEITINHFRQLAEKAGLPVYLVLQTVKETIDTAISKTSSIARCK